MSQQSGSGRSVSEDSSESQSGSTTTTNAKPKIDFGKKHRKVVRILTVVAYIISVSTAAVLLSAYYVFLWKPSPTSKSDKGTSTEPTTLALARQLTQNSDHDHNPHDNTLGLNDGVEAGGSYNSFALLPPPTPPTFSSSSPHHLNQYRQLGQVHLTYPNDPKSQFSTQSSTTRSIILRNILNLTTTTTPLSPASSWSLLSLSSSPPPPAPSNTNIPPTTRTLLTTQSLAITTNSNSNPYPPRYHHQTERVNNAIVP